MSWFPRRALLPRRRETGADRRSQSARELGGSLTVGGQDSFLAGRAEVVDLFRGLAREVGAPSSEIAALEQLPPYLCHVILSGLPFRPFDETAFRYTGILGGDLLRVASEDGSLRLLCGCSGLANMSNLPLDGHQSLAPVGDRLALLGEALTMIAADEDRSRVLREFTSLLVWMKGDGSGVPLLTSSSLPLVPHCSFITDKALRHIPPDTVFDDDSVYALAENLFHESLHQHLSASILVEDLFVSDYDSCHAERTRVPWRGSDWEPDRVLHATFVYFNLLPMRREALKRLPDSNGNLRRALRDGERAYLFLSERLSGLERYLSPRGLEFAARLRAGSDGSRGLARSEHALPPIPTSKPPSERFAGTDL